MAMTMLSFSSALASLSRHPGSALMDTKTHLQPCLTPSKPPLRQTPLCRIASLKLERKHNLRTRISVGEQALSSRRDWCLSSVAQGQETPTVEEELPAKLRDIVRLFQAAGDQRTRYQQLMYYGHKLKPFAKELCIPENRVKGCVSKVWVVCKPGADGRVYFEAEADSALTKGLAALLVDGLSSATPAEVLKVSPTFFQKLGLQQSLTPSRTNGFLNMLKLMQEKTVQACMENSVSKTDNVTSSTATNRDSNQVNQMK